MYPLSLALLLVDDEATRDEDGCGSEAVGVLDDTEAEGVATLGLRVCGRGRLCCVTSSR
jgi:hypothetical protein